MDNQIRATSPTTSVNDAAWIPALWMDSSELSGTSSRPAVFLQEGSQVIPPPTFAPSISQSSRPAASGLVVRGRGRIDNHSDEVAALLGAELEQLCDDSGGIFCLLCSPQLNVELEHGCEIVVESEPAS